MPIWGFNPTSCDREWDRLSQSEKLMACRGNNPTVKVQARAGPRARVMEHEEAPSSVMLHRCGKIWTRCGGVHGAPATGTQTVGGVKTKNYQRSQPRNSRHRNQWHSEVPSSKTFVSGQGQHFLKLTAAQHGQQLSFFKPATQTTYKVYATIHNSTGQKTSTTSIGQKQEVLLPLLNLGKCSPLLVVKPLARC